MLRYEKRLNGVKVKAKIKNSDYRGQSAGKFWL
jgi:hypothetical protein